MKHSRIVPCVALFLTSVGFFVATLASSGPKSVALLVLLPIVAFCSGTAVWFEHGIARIDDAETPSITSDEYGSFQDDSGAGPPESRTYDRALDAILRPSSLSIVLVFSSSISLTIIFVVRLIGGSDRFECVPSYLDFGPKYGDASDEAEPNVAFENEFNSYGHSVQGLLASLLSFPVAVGSIARSHRCCFGTGEAPSFVASEPNRWVVVLAELAAWFMTFYPSYNFVKRTIKHGDTFATSSFMNNGTEWAVGFVVGLSLGMLASSFLKHRLIVVPNGSQRLQLLAFGRMEEQDFRPWQLNVVLSIQALLGAFLLCSVFSCAVLMGYTWNRCQDGKKDCVNYEAGGSPTGIIAGLTIIPTVCLFASLVIATRWRK